jgi:hypothetical protein
VAGGRGFGVKDGRLGGHLDLLVDGPDFHSEIEPQLLADLELKTGPRRLFEAFALDGDSVLARQQSRRRVHTFRVGLDAAAGAGRGLTNGDTRAGDGRARGIGHDAGDLASLREQRRNRCRKGNYKPYSALHSEAQYHSAARGAPGSSLMLRIRTRLATTPAGLSLSRAGAKASLREGKATKP